MNGSNLISDELIYAIGSTLVHSLWQGAIIGLVLFICLRLVPKKNAQLKYWLAITALTGIVFWTGYTLKEQVIPIITNTPVTTATSIQSVVISPNIQEVAAHRLPIVQEFLHQAVTALQPYMGSLVVLWLVGMLLLLVRLQGSMIYLSKLRNTNILEVPNDWEWRVKILAVQLGVTRSIRLVESGLAEIPMVIGHIKPVILLPVGMITGLPVKEVEAVIAHELAHVKRYDYLINIVQTLIESVLFFNPVVWWVSSVIRKQREHCCDDLAVKCCGNHMIYAHALTNLGAWSLKTPTMSMGLFKTKGELLNRIKRLVYPQAHSSVKEKLVPAVILILTLGCLTWYSLRVQAQLSPDESKRFPLITAPWETLSATFESGFKSDTIPEIEEVEPIEEVAPIEDMEEVEALEPMEPVEAAEEMEWVDGEADFDFHWDFEGLKDLDIVIPDMPDLEELSQVIADVNVVVDIPDMVVEDVWPVIMNDAIHINLNDTTREKIQEALEAHQKTMEIHRETWERVRVEHAKAIEKAREKLQHSMQNGRPDDLTDKEWEEVKLQLKEAEVQLEKVKLQTEHALREALSQEQTVVDAQTEAIARAHRNYERSSRDQARRVERAARDRSIRADVRVKRLEKRSERRSSNELLRDALVEDGLIAHHKSNLKLIFKKDMIKVNGKKLTGDLYLKYRSIIDDRFGKDSAGELHYSHDEK